MGREVVLNSGFGVFALGTWHGVLAFHQVAMATQTHVVSGQDFIINKKYRIIKPIGRGAVGNVV